MTWTRSLNGDWDFCPLVDPNPPASLPQEITCEAVPFRVPSSWRWVLDARFDFQPYDLFNYPRHWQSVPAAFLRRRFVLEAVSDERVLVTFEGVLQRWLCFVNGVAVQPVDQEGSALVVESFLPVTFDITGQVRPGENELVVWCGAWEHIDTPAGAKLLNPNGSWFAGLARGIWQDVSLRGEPSVAIADVYVQTSTRRESIRAEITLRNATASRIQASLAAEILDQGQRLRAFEPLVVTLAPLQTETFFVEMAWSDALRWSPACPHLYHLHAALIVDGEVAVETTIRFGFREVWFDGHVFYLNGVRTNLRGDAWHYQGFAYQTPDYARNWFATVKAAGMNFVRLHAQPYPRFFLDLADEMGMLIVDESAIYGSSKATQSDHPLFLNNCQAHLERLVRRDRNHPSVILWSMQNEMRWVDGRDGYRDAMPALTAAMRRLDPTRAIVYDGDQRLVPPEWCDALSLHYNIDGTVDGWIAAAQAEDGTPRKRLPLLFGEHGAFHYASPQVSADLGGQGAYLHFEEAIASIGENERLFIEYARLGEVTGLTPFNLVHYAYWTLPPFHRTSLPNDAPGAGRPNPAYTPLAQACARITVLPNELDSNFYCGEVRRSFSVYNDTESEVQARLTWTLAAGGQTVSQGQWTFPHVPGTRQEVEQVFALQAGPNTLTLRLAHDGQPVFERTLTYRAYQRPAAATLDQVAYYGADSGYRQLVRLVPGAARLVAVDVQALRDVKVLVLGERLRLKAEVVGPVLDTFVHAGGALLVLEQDQLTFGELALTGRKFFAAHPNPADHPVFTGLSAQDLRFWTPDNPHADDWRGLVQNAFLKPVEGDVEILLECAEGAFGWGGLLWTPLVSYRLGLGRAVFCQVAIGAYFDTVPQAAILLRNLLTWLAAPGSRPQAEIEAVERLDAATIERARAGATLLVPHLAPEDADGLGALLGQKVAVSEAAVYQLALTGLPAGDQPFRGVSAHDLFHLERVTYTPKTYHNRLLARHALEIPGAQPLLQDVHNPWRAMFIDGMDGEWLKMAVVTHSHDSAESFQPRTYAARLPLGAGALIFCQILPELANAKVRRIYNRLAANLGAPVDCDLFTGTAPASERGIPAFMGLARQPYQDEAAMRAYFTDPAYTLNNLGEGVYGWMLRLEQREGRIAIPDSAGQTWFLTAFLDSEMNRDPSRRESGELPDNSIIPDLWVEANAPLTVFLNGQVLIEGACPAAGGQNLGDALLQRGINRLVIMLRGGEEDICLRAWLLTKFGEPVSDIRTVMTLD